MTNISQHKTVLYPHLGGEHDTPGLTAESLSDWVRNMSTLHSSPP